MISARVSGMAGLRRALAAAGERGNEALAAAVADEADAIMAESKRRAPVDTGTLRSSGTVAPVERQRGKVSVEMGYGGAASAYALVQHEEMGYNHPVGEAKFLERPLRERAPKVAGNLARRVRRGLVSR